jgi:pimeloyl-ACP methyl ester carboxylesterase
MHLAVRRWPDPPEPGRPQLLLVHGLTASSGTWWRIGPALAGVGWQVIAPDLRCHGASGCDAPIGRWDAADDLAELVDAGAGGMLDVAWGHSLGARTILQLLVRRPGTAARLVLEDPPGVRGDRGDQIIEWRREAALARADPAALAEEVRIANPGWDERDVAGAVQGIADCRIEPIIEAIGRGVALADPAEALVAAITTPALLLLADEERSGLAGASRRATKASLPAGSRTVELATGHSIHRDAPETYLATALDWLGGPRARA